MRSLSLKQHHLHLCKIIEMQGPDEKANSNVICSKPSLEAPSSMESLWARLWKVLLEPQLLPSCTISH